MEFEHKVEYEPFDYGNRGVWTTEALRAHAKNLLWEKEAAENPRKAAQLDRQLGHAAFELWYREHREAPVELNV